MKRTLAVIGMAAVLGACGKKADDRASQAPAADTTATAAAPAAPAGPTDPQIAAIVVAANQVDIDAGEAAKSKSQNAEVKAFAQQMITDHTAVNKQATDLVTKLGVTPEENPTSQQLTSGGADAKQRIGAMSGAAFDKAYVDNEVAYHQTVLDAIDNTLIPSAQNAELKTLLQQVRPAIAAHLDHAKQVQGKLGAP
jgi:putative membrane protein